MSCSRISVTSVPAGSGRRLVNSQQRHEKRAFSKSERNKWSQNVGAEIIYDDCLICRSPENKKSKKMNVDFSVWECAPAFLRVKWVCFVCLYYILVKIDIFYLFLFIKLKQMSSVCRPVSERYRGQKRRTNHCHSLRWRCDWTLGIRSHRSFIRVA